LYLTDSTIAKRFRQYLHVIDIAIKSSKNCQEGIAH